MSALQILRDILSMRGANPPFVFTSIKLVRSCFSSLDGSARPGEELTFRLGHEGDGAERLNGHLFDEVTGDLIARLASAHVRMERGAILCTFTLPDAMTAQRVCLLIEGQRAGCEPGGCEMSLSIIHS